MPRLAEAGVNEAVVAAYLGHTDISTTAKFYQRIRKGVPKALSINSVQGTPRDKGNENLVTPFVT